LLFVTLSWSVIEVKFDWWQLLPRLDICFAAAVVVLTAAVGVFSLFQDDTTLHGEVPAENMAAAPQGDIAPGVAPND
jgi:quinoprotein glucose dehydrogenase